MEQEGGDGYACSVVLLKFSPRGNGGPCSTSGSANVYVTMSFADLCTDGARDTGI